MAIPKPSQQKYDAFLTLPPGVITPGDYTVRANLYGLQNLHGDSAYLLSQWEVERLFYNDTGGIRTDERLINELNLTPLPKYRHLFNMILCDFPPGGNHDLILNWWIEELCYWFCSDYKNVYWNGPGSVGKSKAAAYVLYEDLKAAPFSTYIVVTSNDLETLKERAWGFFMEAHSAEEAMGRTPPGRIIESKPMKLITETEGKKDMGIRCVYFQKGDGPHKVKDKIGGHPPAGGKARLLIEEGNNVAPATYLIHNNLDQGNIDYKCLNLANPDKYTGDHGERLRPTHPDLRALDISPCILHTDKTRRESYAYECDGGIGVAFHADARRSHRLLHELGPEHGAMVHHWMDSQDKLDERLGPPEELFHEGNEMIWTQKLGLVAPSGGKFTVLTAREIADGTATEILPPDAFVEYGRGCGIDWNYGGENKTVLVWGRWGQLTAEPEQGMQVVIEGEKEFECLSKADIRGLIESVSAFIIDKDINPTSVAVDASATQHVTATYLEDKIGDGIYRVSSNEAVGLMEQGRILRARNEKGWADYRMHESLSDHRYADKIYKDRKSELWMSAALFIQAGQIWKLPTNVANQFQERVVSQKHPVQIESKAEGDHGQQYDHGDAFAIFLAMLRERFHVHPRGNRPIDIKRRQKSKAELEHDMEQAEANKRDAYRHKETFATYSGTPDDGLGGARW